MEVTMEGRGRHRVQPEDLPVIPPRARSRQGRAQAAGPGTPPRPTRSRHRRSRAPARHAQGQAADPPALPLPRTRADGSLFSVSCAVLGYAVFIWLRSMVEYVLYFLRSSPPPPWCDCLDLAAALIIFLLLRDPPRFADQELPDRSGHVLATPAPEIQPRQTRLTGSLLDASQVAAVFRSCSVSMDRPVLASSPSCSRAESSDSDGGGSGSSSSPILAASPSRAESSDSDGGGSSSSSSSDDEIRSIIWYASVHDLVAGVKNLVLPGYIHQLQEMTRGLSEADAVDTVRRAFRDVQKDDRFYRLSDAIEDHWALHADTNADSRVLVGRSTGTLVMISKTTAKLLRLVWFELDKQSWQLCQEVKKECFREVAGQSVEKLLDFALSFSNTMWSADNTLQMLTIFDAHVDVLYNISDLPFSRNEFTHNEFADRPDLRLNGYEAIHNVAAHIFCKMVVDFRGILEGTTYAMHRRRESTIHQVTVILMQFLDFFYRNGGMMRSVLGTGHCTIEFTTIDSWVSKLKEGAEAMFQEKGQMNMFILNNIYYVYEVKDRPGGFLSNIDLQEQVYSLLQQYRKSYLDTSWVPLKGYLDGDFLKKPGLSSLNKFTEEFQSIHRRERIWKARTGLKKIVRQDIVNLIVPQYANFLEALQANPSSRSSCGLKGIWQARSEEPKTAVQVELAIKDLFER